MPVRCPDCGSKAFFYSHIIIQHYSVSQIYENEDVDIRSHLMDVPSDEEPYLWCENCGWRGSVRDFLNTHVDCTVAKELGITATYCPDMGVREKDWCDNCKKMRSKTCN